MDSLNMETISLHTTDSVPNRKLQHVAKLPCNAIQSAGETEILHTTDAYPNTEIQCVKRFTKKKINATVLQRIEQELEEFEKISILFLLVAAMPGAYDRIISICKNIKDRPAVIAEFIGNDMEIWEEKLIEALCIIKNREILKNLGYDPSSLEDRYHSDIPRGMIKINEIPKVLYKLFESMGREQTKTLLKYVYEEDGIARELDDSHYLELHALYWAHINYITIMPDGGNLSKLLKHIKRMDYYSTTIYHDVEHFSTSSSQSDSRAVERSIMPHFPETPAQNDVQHNNNADIPLKLKKGKCIIINEVRFPSPYERREGSDADRDSLKSTFSRMGFEIVTRSNLTAHELVDFLKQISDEFDDKIYDCLVICILTHGYEGGIVTCDGKEISNAFIEDKICTPKLCKTIKLLIVQACQGKATGDASQRSDLVTDGPAIEPNLRYRNFARFMSTMSGFASIRHKTKGSWFVQTACEVLSRQNRMTINNWTTSVIQKVCEKTGNVNGCVSASQIPEFTTRLGANIHFPPFIENAAV